MNLWRVMPCVGIHPSGEELLTSLKFRLKPILSRSLPPPYLPAAGGNGGEIKIITLPFTAGMKEHP